MPGSGPLAGRPPSAISPAQGHRSAIILRDVDLVVGGDLDPDPLVFPVGREDVFPVLGALHPSFDWFARYFLGRIPVVTRDAVHRRDRVVEVAERDVFGPAVGGAADADAAGVARAAIALRESLTL